MKKRLPIILTLLLVCIAVSYASAANVVASPQNLSVDGVDADCDKYNIDGSNYFKLRDLAKILAGTNKEFEVSWNNVAKRIDLTTSKAYTAVGGELAAIDAGKQEAKASNAVVYKDGALENYKGYTSTRTTTICCVTSQIRWASTLSGTVQPSVLIF